VRGTVNVRGLDPAVPATPCPPSHPEIGIGGIGRIEGLRTSTERFDDRYDDDEAVTDLDDGYDDDGTLNTLCMFVMLK
jgi:hypothetical protein